MNYKMMGRFIAQILFLEGVFMVPPLCISLYLGETMAIRGFSVTIAIIALLTAFFCQPLYLATDGSCDYVLMWILIGIPFGIQKMFIWLVPSKCSIANAAGIIVINILIGGIPCCGKNTYCRELTVMPIILQRNAGKPIENTKRIKGKQKSKRIITSSVLIPKIKSNLALRLKRHKRWV